MKSYLNPLTFTLMMLTAILFLTDPVLAKTKYKVSTKKEYEMRDGKWRLLDKTSYKYNKKGDVLKETSTSYVSDEKPYTYVYKYSYDSKGHLIKYTENNGRVDKYKYDKAGNNTLYIYYEDHELVFKSVYTYKKKRLISAVHYDRNGLVLTEAYYYNKKGRIKKIVEKNPNGSIRDTKKYTYKYKGKKVVSQIIKGTGDNKLYEETLYYPNGKMKQSYWKSGKNYVIRKYDEKGVLTETTDKYSDGYKNVRTYQDGILQKEIVTYRGSKQITTYEYKTSDQGITQRIEYWDGEPKTKITYRYKAIK